MKKIKLALTHNGEFHADEVLATVILRAAFGLFKLVRSRDAKWLRDPSVDLVYDIGRKYDGEKYFDHHQINKQLRPDGGTYSSCGLIWRKFGRLALRNQGVPLEEVEAIWNYMDFYLMRGVDAADNSEYRGSEIPMHSVVAIIANCNPTWDSEEEEDEAFERAVQTANNVYTGMIKDRLAIVRARNLVLKAFQNRERKEVLVLEKGCNWGETLREIDVNQEVLFVIFPDKHEGYRIQNVKKGRGQGIRKELPSAWRDAAGDRLNQIIGIDDAMFCTGRYIAGARSMSSIRKMAQLAVAQ